MSDPSGFLYRSVRPEGDLGRTVESIWYARGTVPYRRERISPTGSCVAILVLGEPIVQVPDDGRGEPVRSRTGLLVGPHVGPVVNEPTGETHALGVVTRPPGAMPALGIDPRRVRGTVVELAGVWPEARGLLDRVRGSADPEDALAVIEAHLQGSLRPLGEDFARCERAIGLLEAEPTSRIADVARAVGVSHGHLVREFTRLVGLTPRALARIARMRRLLSLLAAGADDWAALAAELGWYDQSHLIRDFKRHTGVTPGEYLDAQAAFSGADPAEGVGFVPE